MKVAVLTVMYAAMAEFADEYFASLKNQTYKDFDLIVINDRFTKDLKRYKIGPDNDIKVFECSKSPQDNRLFGFKKCQELGYDVVICSDSDETMYSDRIEKNIEYFKKHKRTHVVYNNSVGEEGGKKFDLYYKKRIGLGDIMDFNVLGYGAMNVRSDAIPFILKHENNNVLAFDWWIGAVYLLHHKKVDVLKDARNNYRLHASNFIGPVFETTQQKLDLGLRVKECFYTEMKKYCRANDFKAEFKLFDRKAKEVESIKKFIGRYSMDEYARRVKESLAKKEKIYWWQDVMSPAEMELLRDEKS